MSDLCERTYVALLHHPVVNRHGAEITTAITNLDLHDIARACKTYGLAGYYVVTPIERQRTLAERILDHWRTGFGSEHNAIRGAALALARVVPDLAAVEQELGERHGAAPAMAATAAEDAPGTVDPDAWLADRRGDQRPLLLLFGTGWGLADRLLRRVETRLAPLRGPTDYNHLSVRSAVAVYLDRLFGRRRG